MVRDGTCPVGAVLFYEIGAVLFCETGAVLF